MTIIVAIMGLIIFLLLGACGKLGTRIDQVEKDIMWLKKEFDRVRKQKAVGK